ncbi:DMSO/TMAO reductase YedYZ, molybdopterin-dependent catalytic subunit [Georgenia satyanarayanai]|uniref:DMSO/TMAO reductase YedYZ, molybdopterin-dependent catalytic subunit n=1 Tax=Georgenia satyanarayanai TaxID=860221 RepID=A0A2Y8ZWH8_9MICO|nr:molybdopterin-dependent oxidoreductase [Georgenia satyanarayanai]PYG01888.1 DMSO/TMAO reductase YedYZ molybdopterin-dependent catalytic subunit [Georgenia satyanarayanai]SSA36691.1 DMSO/TMAO reductase YedYZ, molybdopterin-dependent catalytic subunit [Georgenia satyanarayanai]
MLTPRGAAALAGLAAGAVTLGVAELLAGLLTRVTTVEGTPSPLLAVADAFVDLTPPWLKDFAVATFGTADKTALFVGMGLVLLAACAGIGLLARWMLAAGLVTFALVGILGVAAVLSRPNAAATDALPTMAGVVVGALVLAWFNRDMTTTAEVEMPGDLTRRSVLVGGGALAVVGVLGIIAGRVLSGAGEAVRAARDAFVVPRVAAPVTIPAAAEQGVPGQTPYRTPNDNFYRIDTALTVPQVDPTTWRLRVHGMVEEEVEIDMAELLAQPMVEALVTLTCVSNYVGGNLAGNAVWTGWPVRELLARARPLPEADMVLSTSADGWTAGTPLEALTDDRSSLLAVGMNGEPLPAQHGFPVRMVVPGLYGYVSATKWVVDLEVTSFARDEGYWTPRGWSERGPIKTASRIDVPRRGPVDAGPTVIAGVAWAQQRGITAVEVRVDDGEWQPATLAAEPTIDSWRMWMLEWDAEPGEHTLTVRATDGNGEVQTERFTPPAPDGASGWHSVDVEVR